MFQLLGIKCLIKQQSMFFQEYYLLVGSGSLPAYIPADVSKNHKLNKYVPKNSNGVGGSSEKIKKKFFLLI